MPTKITAEVKVNFRDDERVIRMELKPSYEIEECEEGKVVVLNLINDETYTGLFKGMSDDDNIILGSLSDNHTIGLELVWVENYWEEIKD